MSRRKLRNRLRVIRYKKCGFYSKLCPDWMMEHEELMDIVRWMHGIE